jgi:DNA invertase Pin-like site-specific DNA recombinase
MKNNKNMTKTKSKNVAYLRVSTIDQDVEKNKADIFKTGQRKETG